MDWASKKWLTYPRLGEEPETRLNIYYEDRVEGPSTIQAGARKVTSVSDALEAAAEALEGARAAGDGCARRRVELRELDVQLHLQRRRSDHAAQ